MTVKSLSATTKASIGYNFQTGEYDLNQLASIYECSRRTIIRVLEEQGINPGVKKRVKKPKPTPVVIPTKTPWWKRIFNSMSFVYLGRGEGPRA